MPPRAAPMTVEERRLSIVTAVLPLVHSTGALPSTREIAQAAGVAEGTIFRAFEDKRALMHALAEHALSPDGTGRTLLEHAAAEPDLRSRVAVVVARLQERIELVSSVMMALRPHLVAELDGSGSAREGAGARRAGPPEFMVRANRELLERLTEVFELDRSALRTEPATAARVLRGLVFGVHHPGMTDGPGLTAEELADVLVDGLADHDHPDHPDHAQGAPC